MSTSSLEDTISAIGYAKVIVALKTAPAAAAVLASVRDTESALENNFIIPSGTQAESLASAARVLASRSFTRAEPVTERRVRVYRNLGLAIGYVNASGLAALEADPTIGKVVKAPELSLIKPVETHDAKLASTTSWGIDRLNVKPLWAAGFTGEGIIVGHLDTGVDGSHPALKGAIGSFAEFDMAGDKVPNAKPTDSGEHGTHTAGTIVGRAGQKGAFGVAPGAKLASAMVIEGGQVIDRILAGMDWIVGEGARILSMSLGLRGFTPAFQTVVDALCAANVLPVIAVGNEGPNTSRSPGNYDNVLSVGAMDVNNQVAWFSSSQQFDRPKDPLTPDLVAPGVDVLSCVPDGQYATMSGSSMATPHVAGLAALLLQAKPDATLVELEQAILRSCSRPAGMPEARANHGVPDALRAYAVLTGAALPSVAAAAPQPPRKPAAGRKPVRGKKAKSAKRSARSKVAAAKKRPASGGRRKKA